VFGSVCFPSNPQKEKDPVTGTKRKNGERVEYPTLNYDTDVKTQGTSGPDQKKSAGDKTLGDRQRGYVSSCLIRGRSFIETGRGGFSCG